MDLVTDKIKIGQIFLEKRKISEKMKRNIKLTIEYDGTDYFGWQKQPGKRSIQEEIEKVLGIFTQEEVTLYGSGRTDAGVHALGQTANFYTASDVDLGKLQFSANQLLPKDIVIVDAEEMPEAFHARKSAKQKTYRYVVLNRQLPSAFWGRYSYRYFRPLDVEKMRTAAKDIVGEHNFRVFSKEGSSVKTFVRKVEEVKIEKEGDLIYFYFTADGFLYNMVRMLTGTLLDIGVGKKPVTAIKEALLTQNKKLVGKNAPPQGLTLLKVSYYKD